MKILLINANPVVSRLLALCTRDRDLLLDEVTGVEEIKAFDYDLLFVDDGSYVDAVDSMLEASYIRKRILISYVNEEAPGFDVTIQKPFLPSQIIQMIESVEEDEVLDTAEEKHFIFPLASETKQEVTNEDLTGKEETVEEDSVEDMLQKALEEELQIPQLSEIFNSEDLDENAEAFETAEDLPLEVLDGTEIEKIKALLEMDEEEIEEVEHLSEDEVHLRKVEVIKEQLISDGLEILDEDEIIEALSTKTKEKALKCKKNKVKYKKEQKKKQAMLDCSKKELYLLEEAINNALAALGPKAMKKFLKGKTVELKLKLEDNE